MPRLYRFDYKTPFFYMVTLKRLPGLADFSTVGESGLLAKNALTTAFEDVIGSFHLKWRCIEKISPFVVMPDHIHLMVKIKATPDRVALGVIISQLAKALRDEYWQVVAADAAPRYTPGATPRVLRSGGFAGIVPAPIFERSWHDWIVKRDGQLAAFRRYIRENTCASCPSISRYTCAE